MISTSLDLGGGSIMVSLRIFVMEESKEVGLLKGLGSLKGVVASRWCWSWLIVSWYFDQEFWLGGSRFFDHGM